MQIGGHVVVEACVQEIRRGKRVCVNICRTYHCTRSKQPARDGGDAGTLQLVHSMSPNFVDKIISIMFEDHKELKGTPCSSPLV